MCESAIFRKRESLNFREMIVNDDSPSRSRDVSNQLLDLADLEGRELLHRGEILDHEGRYALEGESFTLSKITYNVP